VLEYFTTVNSHLDIQKGTDCIFDYYENDKKEGRKSSASLDLKTTSTMGEHILYLPEEIQDKLEDMIAEKKKDEFLILAGKYIDIWAAQIAGILIKNL